MKTRAILMLLVVFAGKWLAVASVQTIIVMLPPGLVPLLLSYRAPLHCSSLCYGEIIFIEDRFPQRVTAPIGHFIVQFSVAQTSHWG